MTCPSEAEDEGTIVCWRLGLDLEQRRFFWRLWWRFGLDLVRLDGRRGVWACPAKVGGVWGSMDRSMTVSLDETLEEELRLSRALVGSSLIQRRSQSVASVQTRGTTESRTWPSLLDRLTRGLEGDGRWFL